MGGFEHEYPYANGRAARASLDPWTSLYRALPDTERRRVGKDPDPSAGDVIWAMNSPQFYLLYIRGRWWTPEFFEQLLADTWKRLLLSA
jgi:hypothetical protein